MRRAQLLTGMSDGGTFTYVLGLRGGCRFTHLAPIAAAFHPMHDDLRRCRPRARPADPYRAWRAGLDVPAAARAHTPSRRWPQAGADVVYREIADLSHTYPRDENGAILDWFLEGTS